MKTKLKEHLLKHGVKKEIANDKTLLGLIDEFIEQFRPTLPFLPTDEEINDMAFLYNGDFDAKAYFRDGLIAMRSHLNQSHVVGEGENLDYWKQRCLLAEKCLDESQCDPDITSDQISAWDNYRKFISDYIKNRKV